MKDSIYRLKTFRVELKVREKEVKYKQKISEKEEAVKILKAIYKTLDEDQEHFVVLYLNNKNQVRGFKVLFSGTENRTAISIPMIFRTALLFGATRIIISHNHPSGDPEPSKEDDLITARIAKVSELLDLPVLDHIIIGQNGSFFSYAEEYSCIGGLNSNIIGGAV